MSYQIDHDVLSQSKINAYRRCGHAYDLFVNQGLVPRVDRPAPALGTAVHFAMASALKGGSIRAAIERWHEESMADIHKKFEPTIEEAAQYLIIKDLAIQLTERNLKKFVEEGWQVVSHKGVPLIEYAFIHPLNIGHWKSFRGTLDLVAKDRSGMPWLIDWKVRGSFMQDATEEANLQMATYQYLLQLDGVEAAGSISWQISDDVPRPPEQIKNGKFSRAAIRTTWDVYAATVKNAGQNPDDYLDMRDKLSLVEWFRLSKAYRSAREVQAVWDEIIIPSAHEMTEIVGQNSPSYVRNFHFINCGICAYRDLCLEALRGGDVDFLKQVRFRHNTDTGPTAYVPPELIGD